MAAGRIKSILVCIEFPQQRQQPALRRAAALARRTGAKLTLFHSTFSPYFAAPRMLRQAQDPELEAHLAVARKALAKLAAPLRTQGVRTGVTVSWDYPPYEAIVREVQRAKPDLVVAGSRRRAVGARLFLTNNDWHLIRLCPVPLLFVKQARPWGKARVLAAIDPLHPRGRSAQLDQRIFDVARAMAQAHAGRLDVVHAFQSLYQYTSTLFGEPFVPVIDPSIEERHRRDTQRALERLAARLDLPANRVHVETGRPAEVLPAMARRLRADLVVMGAVSRSALGRILIGSTTEHVLDYLPCDVLVVKPRGFRSKVPRRGALIEFPPPAF